MRAYTIPSQRSFRQRTYERVRDVGFTFVHFVRASLTRLNSYMLIDYLYTVVLYSCYIIPYTTVFIIIIETWAILNNEK